MYSSNMYIAIGLISRVAKHHSSTIRSSFANLMGMGGSVSPAAAKIRLALFTFTPPEVRGAANADHSRRHFDDAQGRPELVEGREIGLREPTRLRVSRFGGQAKSRRSTDGGCPVAH